MCKYIRGRSKRPCQCRELERERERERDPRRKSEKVSVAGKEPFISLLFHLKSALARAARPAGALPPVFSSVESSTPPPPLSVSRFGALPAAFRAREVHLRLHTYRLTSRTPAFSVTARASIYTCGIQISMSIYIYMCMRHSSSNSYPHPPEHRGCVSIILIPPVTASLVCPNGGDLYMYIYTHRILTRDEGNRSATPRCDTSLAIRFVSLAFSLHARIYVHVYITCAACITRRVGRLLHRAAAAAAVPGAPMFFEAVGESCCRQQGGFSHARALKGLCANADATPVHYLRHETSSSLLFFFY